MQKIIKVGNSKAFTIPKAFADQLGLDEGSLVSVRLVEGEIVLKPARKKYSLEDLVAQMRPEHNIPELITGEFGAEKLEYKPSKKVEDADEPKKITRKG